MHSTPTPPLFVSIPHSGESVPPEVTWLSKLSEVTLMRDVDRYVDKLYEPAIESLQLPHILTQWHRYVVDLNRYPDDFDQAAVVGAKKPVGAEPKGLHWSVTTLQEPLITQPMSMELHNQLVSLYYEPFHQSVKELRQSFKVQTGGCFHLDLHSMPSRGTELHPDPGQDRAEVVVSDYHGASSGSDFRDLVLQAYQDAGFQVAYNWPYVGGGITKMYGEPQNSLHTIQVELNRKLYMNEETKQLDTELLPGIQDQLEKALGFVKNNLKDLMA